MTYANELDANIAAIVNGGFMDPLGDSDVVRMARRIDPQVQRWDNVADKCFRLDFSDGSTATYDVCGH